MFKDLVRVQASIATDEYFYVKFFLGIIVGTIIMVLLSMMGLDKVI